MCKCERFVAGNLIINFYPRILPSAFLSNQIDLPVTVFRDHNRIRGETIMIFGRPGSDDEESGNRFAKEKMISGNPKNTFAKIKNTFAKTKNTIYFSGNRFVGNNLKAAGSKLKILGNVLKNYGNILKNEPIIAMIPGNKLKICGNILQDAGKKLKGEEINLKILGEGMIFVETFRNCGFRIADLGVGNREIGECG